MKSPVPGLRGNVVSTRREGEIRSDTRPECWFPNIPVKTAAFLVVVPGRRSVRPAYHVALRVGCGDGAKCFSNICLRTIPPYTLPIASTPMPSAPLCDQSRDSISSMK